MMNLPSDVASLLIFINESTGGFFGYSFLLLFSLVIFIYFKQNREFIIASAYSLFLITIIAFLFVLIGWIDITLLWAIALLTVVNIMVIYFKKGE